MNEKIIESLSQQFGQVMGSLNAGGELPGQQQMRQMLQSALSRMDLVTREEFDAQQAVLLRTREKVDALEQKLAELESRIQK